MKILWFGIYDRNYSRNSVLITGLRQNGVEVVECRENWKDVHRYKKLIKRLLNSQKVHKVYKVRLYRLSTFDYVYAAYPAPVPTILAKIFARKPVIMDAFYSMFDAVVNDRKEIKWFHPRAIKLLILDWLAVMLADIVIVDTNEHKKYWSRWWLVNPAKIRVVYVGVNMEAFRPKNCELRIMNCEETQIHSHHNSQFTIHNSFLVHFQGKNIPLQGLGRIIEAAKLLENEPNIKFRIVGSDLIKFDVPKNVESIGRVSLEKLNEYLNEADVVLGIFGDTPKAQRVIPNKVFEGLAVKKPVITIDTPAIREIFDEDDLYLIDNKPESIAEAIRNLKNNADLRNKLAENGYGKIVSQLTPPKIAQRFVLFL